MTDQPDAAAPHAGPPAPDPAILAEIDRLDALCRATPGDVAPQIELWKAVTTLGYWVCINRGSPEEPRPYAIAADAGPMLCIYTTADRAKEAAHASGLVPDGEGVTLMVIPLPDAIDWVLSFASRGVVGVTVDHPMIGAWIPLQNLAWLRDQRAGSGG